MEAVAKIPVSLQPEVDEQYLYRAINRIGSAIRNAKPGESHQRQSKRVSNLIHTLMATGQFSTPSQAERYMRLVSGGNYSSAAMGIWARGTSMARSDIKNAQLSLRGSFSEKQIIQEAERKRVLSLQKRAFILGETFNGFSSTTTEAQKAALLDKVSGLKFDLDQILREYRGTNKKVPAEIKKIEKDTKKLSKGLSEYQVSPQKTAVATALGSFAGHLSRALQGIVSAFSFQKFANMAQTGLARGEQDIANQMLLGEQLDIGPARALAKHFNVPEESLLKIQESAITWYTRMINNQLSDQEIYAAARTPFGQAMFSGEAARNPMALYRSIINYVRQNRDNAPEVALELQRYGWNAADIMKLASEDYSDEQFLRDTQYYREQITKTKVASTNSRNIRSWFKRNWAAAEAASANIVFGQLSADQARNLQSLSPAERQIYVENANELNRAALAGQTWKEATAKSLVSGLNPLKALSVVINNNNTMNITGGDSKETAEEVKDQMETWTVAGLNNYIKQALGF